MRKKELIIFLTILFVGLGLIFFRLGRQDMLGDDAHYSFRALGYFDYLGSTEQTTPVQWFGHRPFWSFLSFHDHPPLYFFVQHIVFKLFGTSVVASRLTSAFAGIGSLLVVFFLAKRLHNVKAGLVATGALVINSYFIWMSRIGHLEGLFTFFLLLGVLYFYKAVDFDERFFLYAGIFFGLAFLSKYTFLYVIPGIVAYLVWKKRAVFARRKFWLGVLVFLVVCLPVIIYNLAMYKTRGHFDVQFADLFGQSQADWMNLESRVGHLNLNPLGYLKILITGFSWPYFLVFGLSFFWLATVSMKSRAPGALLIFLIIFSLSIFFVLIGSAARWVGVLSPLAALTIGLAVATVFDRKIFMHAGFRWPLIICGIVISGFSIFYTLNTNTFRRAIGGPNLYAIFRVENYGYNQLDQEITNLLTDVYGPPAIQDATQAWWYQGIDSKEIHFPSISRGHKEFRSLIIFDSNSIWFPTFWMFEKWKFFHRVTIMTADEFFRVVDAGGAANFDAIGYDGIYLIQSGKQVSETADFKFPRMNFLVENFKRQQIEPQVIHDDQGREAFYIYNGKFTK